MDPFHTSVIFCLLALFIYADIQQIFLSKPFGAKPATDSQLITITWFLILFLVLLYNVKLETKITEQEIFFRWGPFMKKFRQLSWTSIERVSLIHYGFSGYGWRLTPNTVIYNVRGNTGLKIKLKTGKQIILGTQKPAELEAFLKQIHIFDSKA